MTFVYGKLFANMLSTGPMYGPCRRWRSQSQCYLRPEEGNHGTVSLASARGHDAWRFGSRVGSCEARAYMQPSMEHRQQVASATLANLHTGARDGSESLCLIFRAHVGLLGGSTDERNQQQLFLFHNDRLGRSSLCPPYFVQFIPTKSTTPTSQETTSHNLPRLRVEGGCRSWS